MLWTLCTGQQRGQLPCGACRVGGARPHAVPRGLGHCPHRAPLGPGHPRPQAAGSGLDGEGAARARRAAAAFLCRVGHGVEVPGAAGHPPHLLPLPHCGNGGFQPARGAGAGGSACLQACERALAGADGGCADWGRGDGDHGWGPWAECGHGLGEAEAGEGGRGMACHARPCGEAAEGGGGADVIDVEGQDDAPPHPLGPEADRPPSPRGH